jgi:hypothetical protein
MYWITSSMSNILNIVGELKSEVSKSVPTFREYAASRQKSQCGAETIPDAFPEVTQYHQRESRVSFGEASLHPLPVAEPGRARALVPLGCLRGESRVAHAKTPRRPGRGRNVPTDGGADQAARASVSRSQTSARPAVSPAAAACAAQRSGAARLALYRGSRPFADSSPCFAQEGGGRRRVAPAHSGRHRRLPHWR